MKVVDSYIDSFTYDETYDDNYFRASSINIVDLVHQLIEKGCSCPTYNWTILTKPLKINGAQVQHVDGTRIGEMYEDDFVNGIDIQRNQKPGEVRVRVFTHWMGEVVCECDLLISKGKFISCSINRLAWGIHDCTEAQVVQYFHKMLQSMDMFKWI